ncbi:unnamed protein product [Polarella glacialis]|uniref:Uncharacterized protein n=1 Tax=Polarella glacialis TaxID=89957 RepID=A0A813GZM8_POLGL|nr:unnamed protein product [Polarella glacialis]
MSLNAFMEAVGSPPSSSMPHEQVEIPPPLPLSFACCFLPSCCSLRYIIINMSCVTWDSFPSAPGFFWTSPGSMVWTNSGKVGPADALVVDPLVFSLLFFLSVDPTRKYQSSTHASDSSQSSSLLIGGSLVTKETPSFG